MNQQTKTYLLWALGIVVVVGLVWWLTQQESATPAEGEPIRVGVLLPISSGPASFYGEYGERGLQLALEENNARGGIDRRTLELVYEDSEGKPRVGLQALNKLINVDGINIVIGDIVSGVTLGVAPVAESNQVVYIAPGSAAPSVSQAGDYIFRTKVAADVESRAAAQFIKNDLGATKVAFIYQNSDYGVGVYEATKTDLENVGIDIVGGEFFEVGVTDMRSQLTKLKNSGAEYILVAAFPDATGLILKQAKEQGLPQTFYAHSGSVGPDVIREAGAAAEGLLFLYEIDLDPSQEDTQEFIRRYKDRYGEEPELFSSLSYDTLMLLAEQIERCSLDAKCIKNSLYETQDYEGITGPIGFDENGDILRSTLTPMTIANGEFVTLE